jgi:hypothetical protein
MKNYLSEAARFLLICLLWHFQAVASAASPENNVAEAQPAVPEATFRYFNRDIVTFRGSLFGISAADRAKRSQLRLQEQLNLPGPYKITHKAEALFWTLRSQLVTTRLGDRLTPCLRKQLGEPRVFWQIHIRRSSKLR